MDFSQLSKAYKTFKRFITTQQQLDQRLNAAVREGEVELAKRAIADGANPSAASGWGGQTPLNLAVEAGNRPMFDMLLAAGADPNVASSYHGTTPLVSAAHKGDVGMAQALVGKKANVNAAGEGGNTAYALAVAGKNKPLMDLLLANGAETDVRNAKGWTPLFYAARNGDAETVALLLSKGARTDRPDAEGRSVLDIARHFDRRDVYKLVQGHIDAAVPAWQTTKDADEVAHVSILRDLGYRLTEVFNTRTKVHTAITHNFETGKDTLVQRNLADSDKLAVDEAVKQLAALKKTPVAQAA